MPSDQKLVIPDPDFKQWLNQQLDRGRIPPLSIVFQEGTVQAMTEERKREQTILQMSFLITNERGEVLWFERANAQSSQAGHAVTSGGSVLLSWSPIANRNHRLFPKEMADIEFYYRKEAIDRGGMGRPDFDLLGVVKNHLPNRNMTYVFYVWEVRYGCGTTVPLQALKKDYGDVPERFVNLEYAMQVRHRGDRRALQLYARRHSLTLPSMVDDNNDSLAVWHDEDARRLLLERPPDVFLSHTDTDRAAVDRVRDGLMNMGLTVWTDHYDLNSGQHWFTTAEPVLRYAGAVVVVCSPAALKSVGVLEEIRTTQRLRAWRRELKPDDAASPLLVPVVVAGQSASSVLPPELNGIPLIDLTSPEKWTEGFERLIKSLRTGQNRQSC